MNRLYKNFLIAISFLFSFPTLHSQPLNGTYTIGSGSSYDYNSFTSAIDSLASKGVSGPVVFNIASGIYNERFVIPGIIGASAANTVTFQSQTGVNTDVVIQASNPNNPNDNYIIKFLHTSYIRLKNVTVRNTSTNNYYSAVIYLCGNIKHNKLIGNILKSDNTQGSSKYSSVIFTEYTSYYHIANTEISGNTIINGSYGIYYQVWRKYLFIEDNTIMNFTMSGIYLNTIDSVIIRNNTIGCDISANYTNNERKGIEVFSSNGINRIESNKIIFKCNNYIYGDVTGILLESGGVNVFYTYLTNNMIVIENTPSSSTGIRFENFDNVKCAYNSVFINNAGTFKELLSLYYADNIDVYNNVFCGLGTGKIIDITNCTNLKSDYNVFYSSTSSVLAIKDSFIYSFASYQSATQLDSNSWFLNPTFLSSTDLHTNDTNLSDIGKPLPYVQTDIDGQLRHQNHPDIGADEFGLFTTDAGLSEYFQLDKPCPGLQNINVRLNNFGSGNLTSANISWEINGQIQTTYQWLGNLAADSSTLVNIGNYPFLPNTGYSIKAYIALCNNISDSNKANDTIQKNSITTAFNSGNYTIGNSAFADFPSITAAIHMIDSLGICGSTVFNIEPGTYEEHIVLGDVTGMNSSNTVTFQSQTGNPSDVTIQYTTSTNIPEVIKLNDAQYFALKNITIKKKPNSNVDGIVLHLDSFSSNNMVSGCNIIGIQIGPSIGIEYLIKITSLSNHNNEISMNILTGGKYSIYIGGSNFNKTKNIIIKNNTINNFGRYGIHSIHTDSLILSGNIIETNIYMNTTGIWLAENDGFYLIEKNKVIVTDTDSTHNSCEGIYAYNSNSTPSNPGIVKNNFISIQTLGNNVTGFVSSGSDYIYFCNNSINIYGQHIYPYSSTALYYDDDNFSCLNNVICNTAAGVSISVPTVYDIGNSDYNLFYGFIGIGIINVLSFPSYLQTVQNKDTNSIYIQPTFVSNTDLHLYSQIYNNKGVPVSYVSDDIDGEPRSLTTPDIGADEFGSHPNDAGIESIVTLNPCPDSSNIEVIIKNYGDSTLTNAIIQWQVNDTLQIPFSWTGSLEKDSIEFVSIGQHVFIENYTHTIKAWTTQPNSSLDTNNLNDTALKSGVYTALPSGVYTVGLNNADFPSMDSVVNKLKHAGICGPVVFNIQSGIYNEQIILPAVKGMSQQNTVTIQSLSGNPSDVKFSYTPPVSNVLNFVLKFEKAKYYRVKNITFHNTTTISHKCSVIRFADSAMYNVFSGNICITKDFDYDNPLYTNIWIFGNSGHNIIKDNIIRFGSRGIAIEGTNNNEIIGNTVSNNIIEKVYCKGIFLEYADSATIENNYISNNNNTSYDFIGVYIWFTDGGTDVIANSIVINTNTNNYGIKIFACNGKTYSPIKFHNNFISCSGNQSKYQCGIHSEYTNHINYYHNTVCIDSSGSVNSNSLYYNDCNELKIKNNIFFNSVGGNTVYYNSLGNNISSNYNNYYSTGYNLIFYSTNHTTLASYQLSSGNDSYSFNVNPGFILSNDPHIFNYILNNAGTITTVNTDIDGEIRNSIHPDIGADEFPIYPNDATMYQVNSPINLTSSGNNTIRVSIQNTGSAVLNSVAIHYILDTISGSYNWTGTLSSQSIESSINVGIHYLDTGIHYLKAWTANPNGVADSNAFNDTIFYTFNAISKPDFSANLNNIITTINDCNDSIEIPLNIFNNGSADLIVSIDSVIYSTSQANNNRIKILAINTGVSQNYYDSTMNIVLSEVSNADVFEINTNDSTALANALQNMDILFIPFISSSVYVPIYNNFTSVIQSFVNDGGTVLFGPQGSAANDDVIWNTGLFNGSYSGQYLTNYGYMTVSSPNHTIMADVITPLRTSEYTYYFNISNQDAEIIATYNNKAVIATRSIGYGKAILLGFNYLNTSANTRSILKNIILWGARTQRFISLPSVNNDTIQVGDSITLNIKFKSKDLNNGLYLSNIFISSNDIKHPNVVFPCSLLVSGGPEMNISHFSLQMDTSSIGSISTDTVLISNTGCDSLFISSITSNNSSFIPDTNKTIVCPGCTKPLLIHFFPQVIGSDSAILSIMSNHYDTVVTLFGTGSGPPSYQIQQNSINITIQNCNDSVIYPIKIKNTGGSPLNITNLTDQSDTVRILSLLVQCNATYYNNLVTLLSTQFSKYVIDTLQSNSNPTFSNALANKDLLVIPYIQNSIGANQILAQSQTIQSFVSNGGTIFYTGQSQSNLILNSGFFGGSYHGTTNNTQLNIQNGNHAITQGASSNFFSGSYNFYMYDLSNTNSENLITATSAGSSYDVVTCQAYGFGYAVLFGFSFNSLNANNILHKLLANTIEWSGSNKYADWLKPSQQQLVINQNDSALINIKFNSSGLKTGSYYSFVEFSTNVPSNPLISIPCTLNVINNIPHTISLGNDTAICYGDSLGYSFPANLNYHWSNGDTSFSTIISPFSTTNLSIIANDGYCYAYDTVNITVHHPNVNIGSDTSICLGDTVKFNAMGAGTYNWNTGDTTSSITKVPLNSTIYSSTVSIGNCTDVDSVNVTVYNPQVDLGNDTIVCFSDTLVLQAPSGFSYLWNTGDTTSIIQKSISLPTMFTITISKGQCSDNDSLLVDISIPNISIGNDTTLCENQSITLNAGSGFNGYFWSDSSTNQTLTIDTTGCGIGSHYISVSVFDSIGCPAFDTIKIAFVDCSGINELNNNLSVKVFPNPTTGIITLEIQQQQPGKIGLCLFNMHGQVIWCEAANKQSKDLKKQIDLSTYPKGIYYLRINDNNNVIMKKVILQ
jgi:parallel beta-helix repeat protein